MSNENILLDYMSRFRLECHCRLDMVPGDIKELPIFIYEGAHKEVKNTMLDELNLNEKDMELIEEVSDFFFSKLKEFDHYTKADDFTVDEINNNRFIK